MRKTISKLFPFTTRRWFKYLVFICGIIAFILIGFFLIMREDATVGEIAIGWGSVLFFGIGGVYAVIQNLRKRAQGRGFIMLMDDGILFGDTLVRWDNIIDIKEFNGGLLVFTDNVEERMEQSSYLGRWCRNIAINSYGTDLAIDDLSIDGSREDFKQLCFVHIQNKN